MSFAFPAKMPELHNLIFLISSFASLSSIISKTWLFWFVIILPYPLGLSVSNPRIEILHPSTIFLIIFLIVFGDINGVSAYEIRTIEFKSLIFLLAIFTAWPVPNCGSWIT